MKQLRYDTEIIKERISRCVLKLLKSEGEPDDARLKEIIANVISEDQDKLMLSLNEKRELAVNVFNSLRRLDVIEPMMQDPSVTEIMVNGPDNIYFEKNGKLFRSEIRFKDKNSLQTLISCFFANSNRPLNEANPISDLRLPDGSRANAVLPPVAPDGPIITIRKFTGIRHDIATLIRQGFINDKEARFLYECVRNKKTIFLCGGTGSGKTTFLNTLSSFIGKDERVVTIEDSAELSLQGITNLVRLEARLPGPDGNGEITIGALIRAALRMRPDRIIVGEVRGTESADMMHALNTGHPGSMCTGHANSCYEMLERLSGMVMAGSGLPFEAVISQISMGIDLIIHITRNRDGKRFVDEISSLMPPVNGEFRLMTLFTNKGGEEVEQHINDEVLEKISSYR
ncbi:MAG: Flp pilus assembly complex ATPase component TadA [Clostridiales bacterium]|nr:Flp pilus assembly complex ATPase component TadA [Clostridiales bacterium]